MIRLIALDLDGTLLGPDFRMNEADGEVVRLALGTLGWNGRGARP